MAALLTPPLTTIRIPREEIAKVAFKRQKKREKGETVNLWVLAGVCPQKIVPASCKVEFPH